jgi:hypothetical protein
MVPVTSRERSSASGPICFVASPIACFVCSSVRGTKRLSFSFWRTTISFFPKYRRWAISSPSLPRMATATAVPLPFPLAPALHRDAIVPGIDAADAVLGVVDVQGIENGRGDVLGGQPCRIRAPLPEPLVPPAVL